MRAEIVEGQETLIIHFLVYILQVKRSHGHSEAVSLMGESSTLVPLPRHLVT